MSADWDEDEALERWYSRYLRRVEEGKDPDWALHFDRLEEMLATVAESDDALAGFYLGLEFALMDRAELDDARRQASVKAAASRTARALAAFEVDLDTAVAAAKRLIARCADPTAEAIAAESGLKLRRVHTLSVYRIVTLAETLK